MTLMPISLILPPLTDPPELRSYVPSPRFLMTRSVPPAPASSSAHPVTEHSAVSCCPVLVCMAHSSCLPVLATLCPLHLAQAAAPLLCTLEHMLISQCTHITAFVMFGLAVPILKSELLEVWNVTFSFL